MNRTVCFLYGLVAYSAFFLAFLYLIGFVGNLMVYKSIDSGPEAPVDRAILIDVMLIALFGIQHSVMARPGFKRWWTKFVPQPIERSTFVLLASLILALMYWQWRPIPIPVWEIQQPGPWAVLTGVFVLGWGMALYSSFLIDHFDLFGLRQVYLHLRNRPYSHPPFAAKSLYRFVRHPLMVGLLIGFWATPTMTVGHLLFATCMSGYILVGTVFEERDLARHLGPEYQRYRAQTAMFLPLPGKANVKGRMPVK